MALPYRSKNPTNKKIVKILPINIRKQRSEHDMLQRVYMHLDSVKSYTGDFSKDMMPCIAMAKGKINSDRHVEKKLAEKF